MMETSFTPYKGWVPENCPKIEGEYFFNVVYHDALGGWKGKAMCGTKLFYGFDGQKKIIRTEQ